MSIKVFLNAHIKRMSSIEIAKCLQCKKEIWSFYDLLEFLLSYLNEIQCQLMMSKKKKMCNMRLWG